MKHMTINTFLENINWCLLVKNFLLGGGGGVEPPTNFSKVGGFRGPRFLEEGCLERVGKFSVEGWWGGGGGCNFQIKKN